MGIRISSSSWRAPLQLIDSWLPAPAPRTSATRPVAPWLRRFAQAGWLGRHPECPQRVHPDVRGHMTAETSGSSTCNPPVRVWSATRPERGHTRLVITGRMADVCEELERLAAQEQRTLTA